MDTVLLLCPTSRELRDLPRIAGELGVSLIYDEFGGDYFDDLLGESPDLNVEPLDVIALIDEILATYESGALSGVTSAVGYPGMSAVSVLAQEMRLPGPRPEPVMLCEHKYYSRIAQQKFVPEATPEFHLVDPHDLSSLEPIKKFPVFLKPVKSCMSKNAYRVDSAEQLQSLVRSSLLPELFIKPFNDMVREYTKLERHASFLLVESLLGGEQVSLEGYVWNGHVHILGIIDAIMFPGTYSFKRFQYPSRLPEDVQEKMRSIARRLMSGLGYDNALFNIELIYNPNTGDVHIIEVNPKIASQFPDLFEKVDGHSSYRTMLEVCLGREPSFRPGQGQFKIAGSCVLRTFQDHKVVSVPSQDRVREVQERFPDAKIQIIATPGKRLSDQMQDSASYRYGLVNIGADSTEALEDKFEQIKSALDFKLEPV